MDDDNVHLKLIKFRVALEKRLQSPLLGRKLKRQAAVNGENVPLLSVPTNSQEGQLQPQPPPSPKPLPPREQEHIPMVSLLIGGGIGSISLVLAKINQSTPVLVFKGSGHAPDLISGAYEDFADRFLTFRSHTRIVFENYYLKRTGTRTSPTITSELPLRYG